MAIWGRSPEMSGAGNPAASDAGALPGVTGRRQAAAWVVVAASIAMSPPWPAAPAGDEPATPAAAEPASGDHRWSFPTPPCWSTA